MSETLHFNVVSSESLMCDLLAKVKNAFGRIGIFAIEFYIVNVEFHFAFGSPYRKERC